MLQPPKTIELHNELYKTKEEQQIFLVFSNLRTRTKGNKQTKQNLFGFSYSKLAIANKVKQMQETKANKW